jgi:hypothetical protein
MRKLLLLFILAIVTVMGLAFALTPTTAALTVHATSTSTSNGFVNLYDKDCTDKTAYGQVIDVTQYYNNVGAVTDNLTTVNGQASYTSGFIDIRGYTYFTTNNDRNFEIILYNEDKEQVAWIAENGTASEFRQNQNTNDVVLLSIAPTTAYQKTINDKPLIAVNQNWVIDDNSGNGGRAGDSIDGDPIPYNSSAVSGSIAFLRVAFPNTEINPYFYAFTDDFAMLIKLNRDDTSGGIMNALMIDIHDGVFTGFTLTALDLDFEVGTVIKNTSNEIIFSVPAVELYFYYTAGSGWQSILTGVEYFSHYGNETVTLNCPTAIAMSAQDLASIAGDNNFNGYSTNNNIDNSITNIFADPVITYTVAILGGLAVLAILSTLIGGKK